MKRTMCMAAAIMCAAAFSVNAQTPTAAMKSSMADKPSDVMTVNGCLQSGQSSSTTTASSEMGHYMLMTSVITGSPAAAGVGSTTGATGATGATMPMGTAGSSRMGDGGKMAHPGASYMLDGKDSELKNHVGHRIEVTGSVSGSMSGMHHGDTAPTATSGSGSNSDKMAHANQTLKVDSIKMISMDCAAK